MSEVELVTKIESALGFELYDWQRNLINDESVYIRSGRHTGKTMVEMIMLLTKEHEMQIPIVLNKSNFLNGRNFEWYSGEILKLRNKLIAAGIQCRPIERTR